MPRLLAISDEIQEQLLDQRTAEGIGKINLILGCGDLPAEYLDKICDVYDAPLLFVRGNHDAPAGLGDYPEGAEIDGLVRSEQGLLIAGLEGCRRYSNGPHQYGEWQMMAKVIGLELRLRRRPLDILITHGPPAGINEGDDFAHKGLRAVRRAAEWMNPRLMLHGHVHPYGSLAAREADLNGTRVINVVGHRVLEMDPK
jgi:Icc-related predicted phosphoesterase